MAFAECQFASERLKLMLFSIEKNIDRYRDITKTRELFHTFELSGRTHREQNHSSGIQKSLKKIADDGERGGKTVQYFQSGGKSKLVPVFVIIDKHNSKASKKLISIIEIIHLEL